MALYLVGETIDKAKAHYQAGAGKLLQLMRGIYVDADDNADELVRRHAIRIAHHLYPKAYLAAASAALLAPTSDGRLYLSGLRNQRTRLRSLEIVQNEAPPHPSIGDAVVDDGMGEFRIPVSSIRQRFLEAFRLRSEHAASIDTTLRAAIAARLVEEYGSPHGAADATWTLARENQWYREGEAAERYLLQQPVAATTKNEAALDLIVAWHGTPIGHLTHDGFEWRWKPTDFVGPPLIRQTTPGKLPPFIVSLLPEGWLEEVLNDKDDRATLRSGKRYMSNITIVEREAELAALPPDILLTPLKSFSDAGVFTGRYNGPGRTDVEATFEKNLARIYASPETPRLSGVQIKAPMFLEATGILSPSIDKPFTHILKPSGTGGYEALPLVEWTAMMLGRSTDLTTPTVALIPMPDDMPPALLVERFDIREGTDDRRMLALEDLCSVLDLSPNAKYDATMERVARAVRPLSTDARSDILTVVKRAVFAWLIADGDMHLKNMALLKVAKPGDHNFHSVRMAPLYDAVTTRVFPNLKHDRMALKLNGRDDNLRRADIRALATNAGLTVAEADAATDRMLHDMRLAVERVALPEGIARTVDPNSVIARMLEICRNRISAFD
ncbi:MAG TPA: type II toxin-antitoxin system HipA family toxin [Steroidobacteraceae bacterium]|nr:type II toxin-antitoxin system HipA family toxin [Steroidobacteraceae bacterium]